MGLCVNTEHIRIFWRPHFAPSAFCYTFCNEPDHPDLSVNAVPPFVWIQIAPLLNIFDGNKRAEERLSSHKRQFYCRLLDATFISFSFAGGSSFSENVHSCLGFHIDACSIDIARAAPGWGVSLLTLNEDEIVVVLINQLTDSNVVFDIGPQLASVCGF